MGLSFVVRGIHALVQFLNSRYDVRAVHIRWFENNRAIFYEINVRADNFLLFFLVCSAAFLFYLFQNNPDFFRRQSGPEGGGLVQKQISGSHVYGACIDRPAKPDVWKFFG